MLVSCFCLSFPQFWLLTPKVTRVWDKRGVGYGRGRRLAYHPYPPSLPGRRHEQPDPYPPHPRGLRDHITSIYNYITATAVSSGAASDGHGPRGQPQVSNEIFPQTGTERHGRKCSGIRSTVSGCILPSGGGGRVADTHTAPPSTAGRRRRLTIPPHRFGTELN